MNLTAQALGTVAVVTLVAVAIRNKPDHHINNADKGINYEQH
jgi:hypothetical protein